MKNNRQFVAVKAVMNIKPKLVRNDTLAGDSYLVVPMVMLVEGVHEGSEGAYLYTNEEMSKRVEVWNRKPVVVYHPDTPSACTQDVLNTRWIGDIMNTKWDKKGKRLLAEAWLKEDRVEKVDNRILEAIQNEETLELSTGLFADSDEEPGEWDGEEFKGTLSNYGPDHLAVLPDQEGACSVKDGAGFYRNEKGKKVVLAPSWKGYFNELSQKDIFRQLEQIISEKAAEGEYFYVEDVFGDHFIWSGNDRQLFQQEFKVVKDIVSITGAPVSVIRKVKYEPVTVSNKVMKKGDKWYVYSEDGKKKLGGPYDTKIEADKRLGQIEYFKKNPKKNIKNNERKNAMDKEKMINNLIASEKTPWEEDDREYLNNMPEERLLEMQPKNEKEEPPKKEKEDDEKKESVTQNTKQTEKKTEPLSEEEYMAQMPATIANRLKRLENMEKAEKDRCIEVITKNPNNTFTKEWLETQDLEMLQNLANIAVTNESNERPPKIHRFNYGLNGGRNSTKDNSDVPVLNCPGDVKTESKKKAAS